MDCPRIRSIAEHFGAIDGAVAAARGVEIFPDAAFERRRKLARLDESERAEYADAYNEAFVQATRLKEAHATGLWLVCR